MKKKIELCEICKEELVTYKNGQAGHDIHHTNLINKYGIYNNGRLELTA